MVIANNNLSIILTCSRHQWAWYCLTRGFSIVHYICSHVRHDLAHWEPRKLPLLISSPGCLWIQLSVFDLNEENSDKKVNKNIEKKPKIVNMEKKYYEGCCSQDRNHGLRSYPYISMTFNVSISYFEKDINQRGFHQEEAKTLPGRIHTKSKSSSFLILSSFMLTANSRKIIDQKEQRKYLL